MNDAAVADPPAAPSLAPRSTTGGPLSRAFRSLATRIHAGFVLVALLPMAAAALATTHFAVEALREEASRHLGQEVTNKATALTHFLEQVQSELRFLGAAAARATQGGPEQLAQLERDYLAFARTYPFIEQLRLLSAEGAEQLRVERADGAVRAVPAEQLQDKSDRYYLHEAMSVRPGEIYASPVDLNEEHGVIELPMRPVVRFATPIEGPAGERTGLLIVNLSARFFLDSIQRLSVGTGGSAYLLQSNGVYLKRDGTPANDRSFDVRPLGELTAQLPPGLLEEVRSGATGTRRLDGALLAFAPLTRREGFARNAMEWQIMVALPEKQLLSGLINIPLLYGGLGLSVLLAWLAGYLVTRRIFNPLAALGRQSEQIAGGDLSSRTDVCGSDEIGSLGRRFNHMAERLESLYQDVERRRQELHTQVRERTADLERERHYLSLILNQVADGILVVNREDRVELANPAARAFLAAATPSAEGEPLSALWPEWASATAEQRPAHSCRLDWTLSERVLSVHVARPEENGGSTGTVLVCRDVTGEREMAAQRRELDRHIFHTEKMNALGEVAVGIAHEVGSPLAGMKAVVQAVLSRSDIPEPAARQLQRIEREVNRLNTFVRSFRGFSAPQDLSITPCSLHEVLDDVLLWTRKEAFSKGIMIRYAPGGEDLPNLLADPNLLKQVLLNLVINAIQAIGEQGGRITIGRSASPDSPGGRGTGSIFVQDTGPGLDPAVQRRIFEPFFTTRKNGSGLGLAIVRSIVEQHGAEIHVSCTPEHGTRFELTWPLEHAAGAAPGPIAV
jgi:signal transduction histidine kinase/HAMP domain-containing protein